MGTLKQEWQHGESFVREFKVKLSRHYMVVGGMIAVETHKNTNLKKKTGKNTRAGRFHFHMVIWFCRQFLNRSAQKLQLALELAITRAERLKDNKHLLKGGNKRSGRQRFKRNRSTWDGKAMWTRG